jgi:hypothetical protein
MLRGFSGGIHEEPDPNLTRKFDGIKELKMMNERSKLL